MKEVINSRQNPKIREVCALLEKKNRRRSGLFRFDGIKLLRDALVSSVEIEMILVRVPVSSVTEALIEEGIRTDRIRESCVISVSESVFEKITDEKSPEGVVTVAKQANFLHRTVDIDEFLSEISAEERLLVAEALRDPGNLGTVMRSCAALGIDRLILTDDCADLYNPKTLRSAMGAMFRLPTLTVPAADLPKAIRSLRASGRRVFAAALREDAEEIGTLALERGDCFVIGNEGHGLSEETVAACDRSAIIPMREGNESLNAAAAAAICIWETVRAAEKTGGDR